MQNYGRSSLPRKDFFLPGSHAPSDKAKTLGHHGRERWKREREVAAREIQMREGEEEGAHGEVGRGARGARAGLGWVRPLRGSKPTTRTTIKRTPIANRKPRRDETSTQPQTKKCASA